MSHCDSLKCLHQGSITDFLTCDRTSWYLDRLIPTGDCQSIGVFLRKHTLPSWGAFPHPLPIVPERSVLLKRDLA